MYVNFKMLGDILTYYSKAILSFNSKLREHVVSSERGISFTISG